MANDKQWNTHTHTVKMTSINVWQGTHTWRDYARMWNDAHNLICAWTAQFVSYFIVRFSLLTFRSSNEFLTVYLNFVQFFHWKALGVDWLHMKTLRQIIFARKKMKRTRVNIGIVFAFWPVRWDQFSLVFCACVCTLSTFVYAKAVPLININPSKHKMPHVCAFWVTEYSIFLSFCFDSTPFLKATGVVHSRSIEWKWW